MGKSRTASHAGTWYDSDHRSLRRSLADWIAAVPGPARPVRAVIAPHAGFRYSGPVAAHCYRHLYETGSNIKRIFILGPSHHHPTSMCLLPELDQYETPFGPLRTCTETIAELYSTGLFDLMPAHIDESEHSIEMHLPFIAHISSSCKIIPIMVGAVPFHDRHRYGATLSPYLDDPETVFVISSDFMHFGHRFGYTRYEESYGPVHASIAAIDLLGMQAIESMQADQFESYLRQYRNTICGRVPISIFLYALQACSSQFRLEFVHYAQSSQCQTLSDSSVSYAAGLLEII